MTGKVIEAAGGIVVRSGSRLRIAVVQRSKDDRWVLPRGKLKRNEDAVAGAEREAREETGHRVRAHEFVGAITYRAQGRAKVVQFWRMKAAAKPTHKLMKDITAVAWLPLAKAVRRLSYPLEKAFLRSIGEQTLQPQRAKSAAKLGSKAAKKAAKKSAKKPAQKTAKNSTEKARQRPAKTAKSAKATTKSRGAERGQRRKAGRKPQR